MNVEVMANSVPKLLDGLALTIELVALALAIGIVIAIPIALARVSGRAWLNGPAFAYVFFFRGTPLLVQIFLIYYGLSQFETIREGPLWPILREPYWCAIIAFTLNTAAYTAEIFRGGIEGVPHGEIEAARALGMSRVLVLRRIILPRAFRLALPAYGNEIIILLKASALASTITLLDLTGVARTIIARTYMPIELFAMAGAIYLVVTFAITRAIKALEHWLSPQTRPPRPA
ncbi:MAG: ABC transporter permease [Alphaproteobacteria bacterium]|nr:ABC transporter permease [Alphaproteobacteria bacterium]